MGLRFASLVAIAALSESAPTRDQRVAGCMPNRVAQPEGRLLRRSPREDWPVQGRRCPAMAEDDLFHVPFEYLGRQLRCF